MFQIETGIKIPSCKPTGSNFQNFLANLKIGQSFVCPIKTGRYAYTVAKKVGIKITVRALQNKSRVWRIK